MGRVLLLLLLFLADGAALSLPLLLRADVGRADVGRDDGAVWPVPCGEPLPPLAACASETKKSASAWLPLLPPTSTASATGLGGTGVPRLAPTRPAILETYVRFDSAVLQRSSEPSYKPLPKPVVAVTSPIISWKN